MAPTTVTDRPQTMGQCIFAAVQGLHEVQHMLDELGPDAMLHTSHTVTVRSAEAVDRAARYMDVEARWVMPDYYRAMRTHRGVTLIVGYCPLREVPPADPDMLGALRDMAGVSIPAAAA